MTQVEWTEARRKFWEAVYIAVLTSGSDKNTSFGVAAQSADESLRKWDQRWKGEARSNRPAPVGDNIGGGDAASTLVWQIPHAEYVQLKRDSERLDKVVAMQSEYRRSYGHNHNYQFACVCTTHGEIYTVRHAEPGSWPTLREAIDNPDPTAEVS